MLGDGPVPEIPSVPTRLDAMSATLDKVLAEVGKLPLDRLAGEVEATLVALHELVTAPELRQAVTDLAAAAGELRGTAGQLADRTQPLIDSLTRTADAAGPAAVATLDAARDVLAGPELREALANLTALSAELRAMPAELQARGVPLLNAATSATEQAGSRRRRAPDDRGARRDLRQPLDLSVRRADAAARGHRRHAVAAAGARPARAAAGRADPRQARRAATMNTNRRRLLTRSRCSASPPAAPGSRPGFICSAPSRRSQRRRGAGRSCSSTRRRSHPISTGRRSSRGSAPTRSRSPTRAPGPSR